MSPRSSVLREVVPVSATEELRFVVGDGVLTVARYVLIDNVWKSARQSVRVEIPRDVVGAAAAYADAKRRALDSIKLWSTGRNERFITSSK